MIPVRGSASAWIDVAAAREAQEVEVSRLFIAEVRGEAGRRDQVRHGVDRLLQDVLDRMELRQRLRQAQQRGRRFRGLTFGLEEFGVLKGHRRVGRQDLEEPLVLLVELPVAEHGERDHAQQLVAHGHGHGEHRLEDVVGAGDLDRERHVAGVRSDERVSGFRDVSGDALADLGDQRLDGVLLVVGEHLSAERDRIQRAPVGLQEIDTAAVVVDDRAQLRGDGRADLVGITQGVELGGQAVEHVELRHRPEVIGRDARLTVGLRSHIVTSGYHASILSPSMIGLSLRTSARSPGVLERWVMVASLAP